MYGMIAAALFAFGSSGAQTEPLGACVWSRLSPADQREIVTAYRRSMGLAMNALHVRDAGLLEHGRACAGRSNLPNLWLQASIAANVIQLGASEALSDTSELDRGDLDAAWAAAPAQARECTLNNASKPFGITGPACRNRRAPEAFLAPLGLSMAERSDGGAVAHALLYMNAKAQEQIAEGLIRQAPAAAE